MGFEAMFLNLLSLDKIFCSKTQRNFSNTSEQYTDLMIWLLKGLETYQFQIKCFQSYGTE